MASDVLVNVATPQNRTWLPDSFRCNTVQLRTPTVSSLLLRPLLHHCTARSECTTRSHNLRDRLIWPSRVCRKFTATLTPFITQCLYIRTVDVLIMFQEAHPLRICRCVDVSRFWQLQTRPSGALTVASFITIIKKQSAAYSAHDDTLCAYRQIRRSCRSRCSKQPLVEASSPKLIMTDQQSRQSKEQ